MTAPRLIRKVWTTYPLVFWLSGSMSDTSERKGCIVTLNDRSIKRRIRAPIRSGANARSFGQFGMSIRATVEMTAPARIKGLRRPSLVHESSDSIPMMGWMTIPAIGAASQKRLSWLTSAPRELKMVEVLEFWREYPICTPRNPKLRFQICQKDNLGFCFIYK